MDKKQWIDEAYACHASYYATVTLTVQVISQTYATYEQNRAMCEKLLKQYIGIEYDKESANYMPIRPA